MMKKFFTMIFCALFIAAPGKPVDRVSKGPAPRILFHWLAKKSLKIDYKLEAVARNELPLPWMYDDFLLVKTFPGLEKKEGLFTWIHPITGMATGPGEMYGEALMMITLKEGPLRIWDIETYDDMPVDDRAIDMGGIDLIHHTRINGKNDKSPIWEEWIIVNRNAVAEFTADPKVLTPIIKRQLAMMRSGYEFKPEELHSKTTPNNRYSTPFFNSDYARENYIYPLLDGYVASRHRYMPDIWKRPVNLCTQATAF